MGGSYTCIELRMLFWKRFLKRRTLKLITSACLRRLVQNNKNNSFDILLSKLTYVTSGNLLFHSLRRPVLDVSRLYDVFCKRFTA